MSTEKTLSYQKLSLITVVAGKTIQKSFQKQDAVIIGQVAPAHFVVSHSSVSSLHAMIKLSLEGATLIDLGSETGVWLNGKKIRETILRNGDKIKVGDVEIDVQLGLNSAEQQNETLVREENTEPSTIPQQTSRVGSQSISDEDTIADIHLSQAITRTVYASQPVKKEPSLNQPTKGITNQPEKSSHQPKDAIIARQTVQVEPKIKEIKDAKKVTVEPSRPLSQRKHENLPELQGQLHQLQLQIYGLPEIRIAKDKLPAAISHFHKRKLQISLFWGNDLWKSWQYDVGKECQLTSDIIGVIEGASTEQPLIVYHQQRPAIVALPDFDFYLAVDGKIYDQQWLEQKQRLQHGKKDLAYVEIRENERVYLSNQVLTFVVDWIDVPIIRPLHLMHRFDYQVVETASYAFLFVVFFVLLVALTPTADELASEDFIKNQDRVARLLVKEEDKKLFKKKFELTQNKIKEPEKQQKKESKAPEEDKNRVTTHPQREKDRKVAMSAGVLGALQKGKGSALAKVFGASQLNPNIHQALGNIRQSTQGDVGGNGGVFATRGTGSVGGESIGIGGLGNYGKGLGAAGNVDLGSSGGAKGEHKVEGGKVSVDGGLSKEAIEKVISRHRSRIRYCYEKELQKSPDLYGKATIKFTISGDGSVLESLIKESTLANSQVEDCLVGVFQKLLFPQPTGGGIVEVSYPMIFSPTGN